MSLNKAEETAPTASRTALTIMHVGKIMINPDPRLEGVQSPSEDSHGQS